MQLLLSCHAFPPHMNAVVVLLLVPPLRVAGSSTDGHCSCTPSTSAMQAATSMHGRPQFSCMPSVETSDGSTACHAFAMKLLMLTFGLLRIPLNYATMLRNRNTLGIHPLHIQTSAAKPPALDSHARWRGLRHLSSLFPTSCIEDFETPATANF